MRTDENLNGLKVSRFNETDAARPVRLTLASLRQGETIVMQAATDLVLQPRRTIGLAATTLWGGFFDTTYAYRFGEPAHDVTVARLLDAGGGLIAEAFHFPQGRGHDRHALGLAAVLVPKADGWRLDLSTRRLAQSVRIVGTGFRVDDNWFHLSPGSTRAIALRSGGERPSGHVSALNGSDRVTWG